MCLGITRSTTLSGTSSGWTAMTRTAHLPHSLEPVSQHFFTLLLKPHILHDYGYGTSPQVPFPYVSMLNSANPLSVLSHCSLSLLFPYIKHVFMPLHMACFMQQNWYQTILPLELLYIKRTKLYLIAMLFTLQMLSLSTLKCFACY